MPSGLLPGSFEVTGVELLVGRYYWHNTRVKAFWQVSVNAIPVCLKISPTSNPRKIRNKKCEQTTAGVIWTKYVLSLLFASKLPTQWETGASRRIPLLWRRVMEWCPRIRCHSTPISRSLCRLKHSRYEALSITQFLHAKTWCNINLRIIQEDGVQQG